MIIPCEIASRTIVPTIRGMVAKELSDSYKMNQERIATVLGITQSAVSQYLGNTRGRALNLRGINEVETVVREIAYGYTTDLSPRVVCQKCCEACAIVRKKKLLCQFHEQLNPSYNVKGCEICMPTPCI